MSKYNVVLLDLDGTIVDSSEGIVKSVIYALEKFGITVENPQDLLCFIGPPILESFTTFYHMNEEDGKKAVAYYRERYKDVGVFEATVYEDVPEMIIALKEQGVDVLLATSKPEIFAKQILEHFNLAQYFSVVGGSGLDGSRGSKAKVIEYVLQSYAEQRGLELDAVMKQAVMVGDRHHDIDGAKEIGIDSIGILFGFGDREELEEAGATYVLETPMDVARFVCQS